MNLIMYVNTYFEDEKALVDLDKKEVLLKGDYYHDKIDYLIEGYWLALVAHGIYKVGVLSEYIDSNHEMFDFLEFTFYED